MAWRSLTDKQWDLIKEHLLKRLPSKKGGRPPAGDRKCFAPVVAAAVEQGPSPGTEETVEPQVITTSEEIVAFYAVRAILREVIPPKRVVSRDAQSYCAILLDDNNRKPICRLRFNNIQKLCLGLFNEKKEEELFPLNSVDDIFSFAERLKTTVLSYSQAQE